MIGGITSMAAFLLSALLVYLEVKEVVYYFLVTGGIAGLGFGLIYFPAMEIIKHWFSKNIGLAAGIATAGSGFGQFAAGKL